VEDRCVLGDNKSEKSGSHTRKANNAADAHDENDACAGNEDAADKTCRLNGGVNFIRSDIDVATSTVGFHS
jgi:hypothetical protein